jgi:hypothetical protein
MKTTRWVPLATVSEKIGVSPIGAPSMSTVDAGIEFTESVQVSFESDDAPTPNELGLADGAIATHSLPFHRDPSGHTTLPTHSVPERTAPEGHTTVSPTHAAPFHDEFFGQVGGTLGAGTAVGAAAAAVRSAGHGA